MQVVISIPDKYVSPYKSILDIINEMVGNGLKIDCAILPKGHGRLIDENELIDEIVCEEIEGRYYDFIYAHSVYDAVTIIEGSDSE